MSHHGDASPYDPLASVGSSEQERPPVRIRMARPIMGDEEAEAVTSVLASGILTNGPRTRRFEELMAERHGVAHGVAMANGTVALSGMYLAADIGPGDEVIVPSLTFISTATSLLHVGATPVFADVDERTYTLDPADVARRITPRTKAIVPVHYAGQPADMAELLDLASAHDLLVLEDAAQAHGASYHGRPAGSWGAAAMFSFTPTKNITTGEGAMVTTDDAELAQRLRLLRNHGMSAQYRHDHLGYNWRLSEAQSAIGCCQMARLDAILARKTTMAAHLGALLDGVDDVDAPFAAQDRTHPYMIYTVRLPGRRDAVAAALEEAGIESRLYFPPAHRQPVFAASACSLPVTEALAAELVSVPFHAGLADHELEEIAHILTTAR